MNDMRPVIIAKSDQLNADDLLGGSITVTITSVSIRPGTEQPISIFYDGDGGKPYKCCKSMARVMVHAWGPDASQYVGRSMTLYCDPKVMWGGMAVGGIRISHMTDISAALTMALTVTKGSKKPFTVKPLVKSTKAATTIAEWIAGTLAPALDKCEGLPDLEKARQNKPYLAAIERGTDDDRAEMKRLVDEALSRIQATSAPADEGGGDVGFPGDAP